MSDRFGSILKSTFKHGVCEYRPILSPQSCSSLLTEELRSERGFCDTPSAVFIDQFGDPFLGFLSQGLEVGVLDGLGVAGMRAGVAILFASSDVRGEEADPIALHPSLAKIPNKHRIHLLCSRI